ncbi:MAG: hypothetical protein ACREX8_07900 [Gammaproteobacteria bacterium]
MSAGRAAVCATGDLAEVLAAEAAEVARQECRVDVKAGQLATLAGTLSTVAAAAGTGVVAVAPRVSGWLWLAGVPLLVAAVLWAGAVVVLLRRIIRPRLAGVVPGSFVRPGRLAELRGLSLTEYRESFIAGLGGLVLARYRAVRVASDLLVAGFVPLLVAGLGAGAGGLIVGVS